MPIEYKEDYIYNAFEGKNIFNNYKTLAAYLSDQKLKSDLASQQVKIPSYSDFNKDLDYGPLGNEHLSPDSSQLNVFVRSLAAWGEEPLIKAAMVCGQIQVDLQFDFSSQKTKSLRDQAYTTANQYYTKQTVKTKKHLIDASEACEKYYSRFNSNPDNLEARIVWLELGAPWFAALALINDYQIQTYDHKRPKYGNSTWLARNTIPLITAADIASQWSSELFIQDLITAELISWSNEKL